jgi:ubiquinone/menaquinone biosynthesis C-methylase UbiE
LKNRVEEGISKFYSEEGWDITDGVTEDARRWEDLRECAREYVAKCRLRILRHIPQSGEYMLDMASGPIQYKEYLLYSRNFKKRYCVDLSSKALDHAKDKLGDHGVFLHGSFFDLEMKRDFFDCTLSLHTIFHMDKDRQEEAVRKLINVTKPGKPVIIIYLNPKSWFTSLPARLLKRFMKRDTAAGGIYLYAHPLSWWNRFRDVSDITILPWRTFGSGHQKRLVPDNRLGKLMLSILFLFEDTFSHFFSRHCFFPLIILTKKTV